MDESFTATKPRDGKRRGDSKPAKRTARSPASRTGILLVRGGEQGPGTQVCARPVRKVAPRLSERAGKSVRDVVKTTMLHINVLLANDQPVLSKGLRELLAGQPDLRVVDEAASGPEAVQKSRLLKPDVVLMDLALPESDGIVVAEQIRRDCPATQVVILSEKASDEHIFRALKAGALGYVLKEPAGQEMMDAIRAARAGRRYLSPGIADIVVGNFVRLRQAAPAPSPLAGLSDREREVLTQVVAGHPSKAIAARLHLATSTVDTYRSRIMRKLGVDSVASLVRFALHHDMTPSNNA